MAFASKCRLRSEEDTNVTPKDEVDSDARTDVRSSHETAGGVDDVKLNPTYEGGCVQVDESGVNLERL